MDRDTRRLHQNKADKAQVLSSFPSNNSGRDGDVVYVKKGTGMAQAIKADGRWIMIGSGTPSDTKRKTIEAPTRTIIVNGGGNSGSTSTAGVVMQDGSVPFSSVQSGVSPTADAHLSTKKYVDDLLATEDTLSELNDTTITSVANGNMLKYDTGTNTWINFVANFLPSYAVNDSYTGSSLNPTVFGLKQTGTSSITTVRGIRSANSNMAITLVESVSDGAYLNFNVASPTGITSVTGYDVENGGYDSAITGNTALKFNDDYDTGTSTGIFFVATDSGNDTIISPNIVGALTDTTYTAMGSGNSYAAGLVLAGSNTHANSFLRKDGSWQVPIDNNTTAYTLSDSTGVTAGSSHHGLVLTGEGAATTGACLRNLVAGNNITMSVTDTDTDTGYIQVNADLSGATISTSEVNPLGGYLTYSASNMRFLDGTGITWALVNQGSGVIELTPTVTITDTNTQNVFASSWVDSSADVLLRLTKSGASSGTQDIKLVAGSNIYLTPSGTNMTIASNNTTNYSLVNSDKSSSHSFVMTNSGTEGRIRNIKAGSNITMTTTDDDSDTGYVTVNASLSNATINASEVNPLGGYLTYDSADIRFIDNGRISWALGRPGSNVTTVTPTITNPSAGDVGAISTSHQANNITSTHITVLGNTSGTNSGDQTIPTRDSLGIDTNDAVTFAALTCSTLNTGQGATEVYLMNQNVKTDSDIQFDSFGVGTAASGVTGEIRATNEVTAYYSDDRLKTKHGNIEKALEKVCSLNGFHYSPNELAGSLGYDTSEKKVGVSAQEVLKILPEAVTAAPIDPQYHAVQYDKLVPLLVEAIKELSERKCSCGV